MQNKNLTCRDFSNENLRRVNFKNSILIEANFVNVVAGITPRVKLFIIVVLFVVLNLGTLIFSYSNRIIGFLLWSRDFIPEFAWITILSIVITVIIFILKADFRNTLLFSIIVFSSFSICVLLIPLQNSMINGINLLYSLLAAFFIYIGFFTGFSILVELAIFLEVIITNFYQKRPIILALSGITILLGITCSNLIDFDEYNYQQLVSSVFLTLSSLPIVVYVQQRALAGDKKYLFFKTFAIRLCSMIGTTFEKADLTDADFTGAELGNTNFTKANLTRTCWRNARNLHKARVEGTYLENEKIRQLLVTGNGRDQNFDGLDLRGCNLRNADLTDASFINAKLSEATLEGANLTRAKLAKAQLYGTNLTNATLTGACIQDWAISLDTQFEGIKCEYVYMRLETKENPDPWRKPDNRNETFKDGDFSDFIAPIIKTQKLYQTQNVDLRKVAENYTILDLFHHEGVDPSAAAIAFQQLIDKYPESGLQVLSIQGRGNEKIHFQAQVTDDVNRSLLSQEYSAIYNQIKSGTYTDLQAFLAAVAEKDQQIRRFQELLENAIQQPKFYVETYRNVEISQGDYRETSVNDQGSYTEGDAHHNSPPETP
ncbi:pentapeptide repeat-containing protein [Laspinema olomoucense]|uniref:pentapeptide repeat-containing protein n=1 Tax=Laspinema olomoucense TaxID=3231600 RepID=UPI0021BACCE3|nr:pentapeptide repeat-containing protein [Laspinema sp. D3d]MCT7973570.1 pentapeptide repeat-containing protein [Laspinema sp. D3d]